MLPSPPADAPAGPRDPAPASLPAAREAASAVWTRPIPLWRLGLRGIGALLGVTTLPAAVYFGLVAPDLWQFGILSSAAVAVLGGLGVALAAGAQRIRLGPRVSARLGLPTLGAMLATEAIVPWLAGGALVSLTTLALAARVLSRPFPLAYGGALLASLLWTVGFTRVWRRRQPVARAQPPVPVREARKGGGLT